MAEVTYNTKQKQLILDLLRENKNGEFTCAELEQMLFNNGTPVGKSTLYRFLLKLQKEGLVKKFNEGDKTAYFRFVDDKAGCACHIHLKCSECGRYIHLDCKAVDEIREHIKKDHGFEIDYTTTVIYGRCEDCKKKEGGE